MTIQRAMGGRPRLGAPQRFNQPIARHDLVGGEEQRGRIGAVKRRPQRPLCQRRNSRSRPPE
jgi:hypothetical protein